MKTFHFISGLPRSGSTLLCNILLQNPRFHATSTSGVHEILLGIRNTWNDVLEFKATPNEKAKFQVMRGIMDNFYEDVDRPIIFDKSRAWVAYIEMLEHLLGRKVKILVPVRDIRDILASFELRWRETSKLGQTFQEKNNQPRFQTLHERCNLHLEAEQPLGIAYRRIKDAIKRGYSDRMFIIDFDDLTSKPKETMQMVYDFIGEPYFEHDFNNVEQITKEDDSVHGFKDLHTIRNKVEPIPPRWPKVLGKSYEADGHLNFWKP